MKLGGIIEVSTKDIPGKACTVLFTVGCNFKCEFCHNKYLLNSKVGREYSINEILNIINNNYLINAVSISGGEPTLQGDLPDVCKGMSELNKYLSLDTNGSQPEVIKSIIPYVNRIALDIKAPLEIEKLSKIAGININPDIIIATFELINMNKSIEFEIRTTYVNNLHTPDDLKQILNFLIDHEFSGRFVLQQYQYSEGVGENNKDKFEKPEHGLLINLLKNYREMALPFKIYLRDDVIGYKNLKELFKHQEI